MSPTVDNSVPPESSALTPIQQERAAALRVARRVLESRGPAPAFGGGQTQVEPTAVVIVAEYVLTGQCEWLPGRAPRIRLAGDPNESLLQSPSEVNFD